MQLSASLQNSPGFYTPPQSVVSVCPHIPHRCCSTNDHKAFQTHEIARRAFGSLSQSFSAFKASCCASQ